MKNKTFLTLLFLVGLPALNNAMTLPKIQEKAREASAWTLDGLFHYSYPAAATSVLYKMIRTKRRFSPKAFTALFAVSSLGLGRLLEVGSHKVLHAADLPHTPKVNALRTFIDGATRTTGTAGWFSSACQNEE